jgi:acyl-CoA synthetase (NDP forming)
VEGPLSVSTGRDLRPLFDPRSVAILGASATPGKWGNWLARNALRGKDRRRVFLVNRAGADVLGERAYPSLRDLPQPVEMVVIAIGVAGFEEAVIDSLHAGAKAIVAITAGLGEAGVDGREVERRVVERVRAAGAVLVGPNCLGVADTGANLDLAFSAFEAGPLGLVSQSGNLALEIALIAGEAGLGFSRFVSVGNQADLEAAELIDALAQHEQTRVIAVYLEGFRDGRAFVRAALRARELGKPVVLLTVGSSGAGARAALSHTGALVSKSVAIDAACAAGGILRVRTPRDMIDLARGLLMPHRPRGVRVGVVGDGGGHVALAADLATEHGLELPLLTEKLAAKIATTLPVTASTRNPVDLAGGGEQDFHNYARAVRTLAESGEVDAVLLTGYFGGYSEDAPELAGVEAEVAKEIAAAVAGGGVVVVHSMYATSPTLQALRSARVPVYSDIRSAAAVLSRLGRGNNAGTGVPESPAEVMAPPVGAISKSEPGREAQGYFEARRLLAAGGLQFVDAREASDLATARAAAAAVGFPVVLKAVGRPHKSDAGGVRLGIEDPKELDAAFREISARLRPQAWSVERMAADGGVELLVGVIRDHSFGPVVAVGAGGLYAELLQDVAVALAPVSEEQAEVLIRSLRIAPLLLGARGLPALDIAAAARATAALSRLVSERPEIAEAEINPLLVGPQGALALDARVVV